MPQPAIPYTDLTYQIIGAAMRVHRRMARGLREMHYHHALTQEMRAAGLAVSEEHSLEIYDRETWLGRFPLLAPEPQA